MQSAPRQSRKLNLPRLPVLGFPSFQAGESNPIPSVIENRMALLTTSARAAFLQALRALGVSKGDRVLVPTYHCPTMISPVVRLGATPLFYPITATGLPSGSFLETVDAGAVKVMLAAHFFGLPLPLQGARTYCDARQIALVEDCAHAFFGEIEGRAIGSVGDVALASLPKFFPVTEGGCLVGPKELLARMDLGPVPLVTEVRSVIDAIELGTRFGRLKALNSPLRAAFSVKDWMRGRSRKAFVQPSDEQSSGAADQRDPWLEEAMVERRMTRSTEWLMRNVDRARVVQARRRNYALLSESMSGLSNARPLFPDLPSGAVPYVFPLDVSDPDPLYAEVRAAGVPVFRWDRLWPGTPMLADDAGRRWSHHVFQIGCHQDLSESDIRAIVSVLKAQLSRGRH